MIFDLGAALRRLKPGKLRGSLARRIDRELPFLDQQLTAGPPLLLDTTVYIDLLADRTPPELDALLSIRHVNHSSIALAELAYAFGRLDPAHPETAKALAEIMAVIERIPQHRLAGPSSQVMLEAGIVTGLVARLAGSGKADRQLLFNDACLFLHARETGSILLSANISDMDLIGQLVPDGQMLLYRRAS